MESLSSPFRAPARNLSVVQRKFDPDEHAFYKTLSERMTAELDKLFKANEASKNYTRELLMLLRLKQGELPYNFLLYAC